MKTKNEKEIYSAIRWLCHAQDANNDGGVSAWFSLVNGWQPSYIETTGYIIQTFFAVADFLNDSEYADRAVAMANFIISMQLQSGAIRAYTPSQNISEKVVVFDMGQDLLGLCEAYTRTKNEDYIFAAQKAAHYLRSIQESNGSWITNTFGNRPHAYHSRVAWGIAWVGLLTNDARLISSARNCLEWVVDQQNENGWFKQNELPHPKIKNPFTHTIAYAIEGLLWSGLLLKEEVYVNAGLRGSVPLLHYFLKNNTLPATFDDQWRTYDRYQCITGNAQFSVIWWKLFHLTNDARFKVAAKKMNQLLKSIQVKIPLKMMQGALPGSLPIFGDIMRNEGYCRLSYPNWGTKFYVDALLEESYAHT